VWWLLLGIVVVGIVCQLIARLSEADERLGKAVLLKSFKRPDDMQGEESEGAKRFRENLIQEVLEYSETAQSESDQRKR